MLRIILVAFVALFGFVNPVQAQDTSGETVQGEIVKVEYDDTTQIVTVDVYKGSLKGERIEVINDKSVLIGSPEYQVGDKVEIMYVISELDGSEIFYITDYVRYEGILFLFIIFVALAVMVGGVWGATSLIGMAFSFLIIFQLILPQILAGRDAVLMAIIGSIFIIPATFSLSHGLKLKTAIATLSTIITLAITGLISIFAVQITYLTGYGSEEVAFLANQYGSSFNPKGLLLAGMIISTLGVLDDITISQASIVAELKSANKKYNFSKLFSKAMNVGRDHIASLINTLVLVYAGASLPLLLLFVDSDLTYLQAINVEFITEEIVRTLVGSMGLIMAVPITTAIAAYYYRNK